MLKPLSSFAKIEIQNKIHLPHLPSPTAKQILIYISKIGFYYATYGVNKSFTCMPCFEQNTFISTYYPFPVLSNPSRKKETALTSLLRRERRWGPDIFGKGCSCDFHVHCHTDAECRHHAADSHEVYICYFTKCCGTKCVPHHMHVPHTSKEVGHE